MMIGIVLKEVPRKKYSEVSLSERRLDMGCLHCSERVVILRILRWSLCSLQLLVQRRVAVAFRTAASLSPNAAHSKAGLVARCCVISSHNTSLLSRQMRNFSSEIPFYHALSSSSVSFVAWPVFVREVWTGSQSCGAVWYTWNTASSPVEPDECKSFFPFREARFNLVKLIGNDFRGDHCGGLLIHSNESWHASCANYSLPRPYAVEYSI
jgi:hypothetical protein